MAITLALLWTTGAILADPRSGGDDLDRVIARANSSAGHPPYRAFRRLEAGNPRSDRHAWLEAWTERAPGRGFTYEVVAEGGHHYIRNKVLRDVLNSEQKLIANGQPLRASLVASNYAFDDGGTDEAGRLRVLLKPLRKAAGIVSGSVLIDPTDARLVQIQGRLVKNPSFWIRNVDIVWKYERIGEEIVPVEVSSAARVRLFGMSSFRMEYEYVSIAGRAVTDGPQRHRDTEKSLF
jgi:hypothetical protein